MKKIAVRNLRLCTKDCLCLYVCPTGASDTENSIIDVQKCVGCGACAEACPSKAISMVPLEYPIQQKKKEQVLNLANRIVKNKAEQEKLADTIEKETSDPDLARFAKALKKSIRLVNEDIVREAGYMLPQSGNTCTLLEQWIQDPPADSFPVETAKALLEKIHFNEKPERTLGKWQCEMCGYIYEGYELPEDFTCPICNQPASAFKKIA